MPAKYAGQERDDVGGLSTKNKKSYPHIIHNRGFFMFSNIPRTDACRRELLRKHWQIVFSWDDLADHHIKVLADEHNLTVPHVRKLMREIAKQYPKPTSKPKPKDSNVCEACGVEIVWMSGKPFDPPIMKVGLANGNIHTARRLHDETCTGNYKAKSRHAAACRE